MPRKLGQHFLRDEHYARRIASALALAPGELLIEIGPGRGAVTRHLVPRVRRLVAIEIDPALACALRETYPSESGVEIIEGDVLRADLCAICRNDGAGQCFVFGNLPYYITSPILRHLFEARHCVRRIAALVQREVADRITACAGSRDYGYLSVLAQTVSRPRILFEVPPGSFSPPPKVRSALVDFEMAPRFPAWTGEAQAAFLEFAAKCFGEKRKTLLNNLSRFEPRSSVEQKLTKAALDPRVRAEQLSIEQLAGVFERVEER